MYNMYNIIVYNNYIIYLHHVNVIEFLSFGSNNKCA